MLAREAWKCFACVIWREDTHDAIDMRFQKNDHSSSFTTKNDFRTPEHIQARSPRPSRDDLLDNLQFAIFRDFILHFTRSLVYSPEAGERVRRKVRMTMSRL